MPNEFEKSEGGAAKTTHEASSSEALLAEASSLLGGIGAQLVSRVREVGEDVVDHFKLNPEQATAELAISPLLLIYDATTRYDLDRK